MDNKSMVMGIKEIITLLGVIEMNYSSFKAIEDVNKIKHWQKLIGHLEPKKAMSAIMVICQNETYPPSPATLIEYYDDIENAENGNPLENIKKAISTYGRNRYTEFYQSLTDHEAKIVKSIGFNNLMDCKVDRLDGLIKNHSRKIKKESTMILIAGGRGAGKILTNKLLREGYDIG